MPTFRDINQFNAVANNEVNPDWTLQVSATQKVTLQQIANLYKHLNQKTLTLKAGTNIKTYNGREDSTFTIRYQDIGAAPSEHTHKYDQITGNSLSLIFDTGINKIGIDKYAGGELNKEVSTLELMGLNIDKPYLTEILSNTGFNDLDASGLFVNYGQSFLGITNQEFFLRIPFSILVKIPSNNLNNQFRVKYLDTHNIDISELDPFFKPLFTQTPPNLGSNWGNSPIISRSTVYNTSILMFNSSDIYNIYRPLAISISAGLRHASDIIPVEDKLTLEICYEFYNSGDYTVDENDSFSGAGIIDIRVPIADLVFEERANFVESTTDDIEV